MKKTLILLLSAACAFAAQPDQPVAAATAVPVVAVQAQPSAGQAYLITIPAQPAATTQAAAQPAVTTSPVKGETKKWEYEFAYSYNFSLHRIYEHSETKIDTSGLDLTFTRQLVSDEVNRCYATIRFGFAFADENLITWDIDYNTYSLMPGLRYETSLNPYSTFFIGANIGIARTKAIVNIQQPFHYNTTKSDSDLILSIEAGFQFKMSEYSHIFISAGYLKNYASPEDRELGASLETQQYLTIRTGFGFRF